MATGFVPYLLKQSQAAFMGASPASKITPPGFLKYLLDNGTPNVLSGGVDDGLGHLRDVNIKIPVRGLAGSTSTTDDCLINAMPVYAEDTVDLSYFRKSSLFIPDETIARYENEASQTVAVGAPSVGITREIWDAVIRNANALFSDINSDLCAKLAINAGVNATTGLNTPKTVNFPLSTTNNALNTGMNEILSDIMVNEMNPNNVAIVGAGLINNYMIMQAAKSYNLGGLNTALELMPKFYHDVRFTTSHGANEFVVLDKNSVQLIKYNRFRGFKGGDHLTTFTGTITLPVIDSAGDNQLSMYEFDYQLKYNDCPQTVDTDVYGYGGSSHSIGRGWIFTLMSSYDIYTMPSSVWNAADRLAGNNGVLGYVATNS